MSASSRMARLAFFSLGTMVGASAYFGSFRQTENGFVNAKSGGWGGFGGLGGKSKDVTGKFGRDPKLSKLNVWVFKEGPLSFSGHNLLLAARDWNSNVTIHPNGDYEVEVTVQANSLEVEAQVIYEEGKDVGGKIGSIDGWSKGQIVGTMRGKGILNTAKFPTVVYRGKGKRDDKGLVLDGTLNLVGVEKPLKITGTLTRNESKDGVPHFVLEGDVRIAQSNWGITPLSQGFGALRLKDNVRVSWEVHYTQLP